MNEAKCAMRHGEEELVRRLAPKQTESLILWYYLKQDQFVQEYASPHVRNRDASHDQEAGDQEALTP
jgi:hypothetical protein